MKVVVISDTHMPRKAIQLPRILKRDLEECDFIIHAGDWQTVDLYYQLQQFAPTIGVTGNVDGRELKSLLKTKELFIIGEFRIGIVHGHGTGKTTEKRAIDTFADDVVDCIIYGHSHIPILKENNGVILFNPGSPIDKRRQKEFSYGILTIGEKIIAKHIFFEDSN